MLHAAPENFFEGQSVVVVFFLQIFPISAAEYMKDTSLVQILGFLNSGENVDHYLFKITAKLGLYSFLQARSAMLPILLLCSAT